MMIAGGVLALFVTIIVIVVVVNNNKEDEKPKGEKPKGETPPPAKCQSGQYKDTKGVCKVKSKKGQICQQNEQLIKWVLYRHGRNEYVWTLKAKTCQGCGKDGDDTRCKTGVCGQYKNNEYKCCKESSTL